MLLEELAERIASVQLDHPLRVAIDGRSCAGKSTLADGLAPLVEAHGLPVLRASVDGFHLPRAERYRRGRLSAEGYYFDSFDLDALRRSPLDPLGPGSDRGCRTAVFDARTDAPVEPPLVVAAPDAVLL
jgi:uridine kinase